MKGGVHLDAKAYARPDGCGISIVQKEKGYTKTVWLSPLALARLAPIIKHYLALWAELDPPAGHLAPDAKKLEEKDKQ